MPKKLSQSAAAVFARLIDRAPTPWITVNWQGGAETVQVKFRLWIWKRGLSLHVETHPDSVHYPGITKKIVMQRTGLYEVHQAGMLLVRCAAWEPSRAPSHPRAIWNPHSKDYMRRQELAQVVGVALPRILVPKRGRSAHVGTYINPTSPVQINGAGRAASKRIRREQLLVMLNRIMQMVEPYMRTTDVRALGGYMLRERAAIRSQLRQLKHVARTLHDDVFYDRLLMSQEERNKLLTPRPRPVPTAEGEQFDWQLEEHGTDQTQH